MSPFAPRKQRCFRGAKGDKETVISRTILKLLRSRSRKGPPKIEDRTKRNAEQADVLRTPGRAHRMSCGLHSVHWSLHNPTSMRTSLPLTHRIASAVFQSLRLFNLQTLTPQRLDDRRNNPQMQSILSCVETNGTACPACKLDEDSAARKDSQLRFTALLHQC